MIYLTWVESSQAYVCGLDRHLLLLFPPPLYSHNLLRYFPISLRSFAYISFLLYFGMNTIWYWQFHFVWDKLLSSSFFMNFILKPPFNILGNQQIKPIIYQKEVLLLNAIAFSVLTCIARGFLVRRLSSHIIKK